MKPSTRNAIVFLAKAMLAALLIAWLVRSGNLDVKALRAFVDRPVLLAADLGVFVFGAFIATLRFRVLLGIVGVRAPLPTIFRLQMTAFFFNVVIPGSVGGDVVKALYIARDEPRERRTTIVLLAFVERLAGLAGLILMGTITAILRGGDLWQSPLFRPLVAAVVGLGITTLLGGGLTILLVRQLGARLDTYTRGTSRISKIANQLVAAARVVSAAPDKLVVTLALSMAYHAVGMGFFLMLTRVIVDPSVAYSAIATVFPLGFLALALPISPSGLGVGHVAFDRLFEAIGLAGGATVFNVYVLGQMVPCLFGIFPFLAMRRRGELPSEAADPKA